MMGLSKSMGLGVIPYMALGRYSRTQAAWARLFKKPERLALGAVVAIGKLLCAYQFLDFGLGTTQSLHLSLG